ncbi:HK97-gp10 family putative phage morphogenesis protein [Heyndrickxia camelliae]|uniref:HK97 gp10 family phage protein n=1 Tax=Heyndrickxia camelliae TaxID=1707093 RepID=A0A2N3LJT5_9BACI|nr:HK97-gp10 family putative phage morphogenesis protein [Heyndrickxia camelliae]PKR84866.1 hypothetical protein CWO92_10845 [Heyndrickxia camelliae]
MSVDVSTTRINDNLRRLAIEQTKVRNRALKEAGKRLAQRLRENTPVDGKTDEHMRDDVRVSGVKDGEVTVGFGKDTAWRAHFVEMGTIKQRPQGFIQRTEEEMRNEILQIVETELRRGFGL